LLLRPFYFGVLSEELLIRLILALPLKRCQETAKLPEFTTIPVHVTLVNRI